MLGSAGEGFDYQAALNRQQQSHDDQRRRQQVADDRDAARFDQETKLHNLQMQAEQLGLDDKKLLHDTAQHQRDIGLGMAEWQATGDPARLKAAYNNTAGAVHGHQVTDIAPNKDGTYTVSFDDGGSSLYKNQMDMLNDAYAMSDPMAYMKSVAAQREAQAAGVIERAKDPKKFGEPITGLDGRMYNLDYGTNQASPILDADGNPVSGYVTGKVYAQGSRQGGITPAGRRPRRGPRQQTSADPADTPDITYDPYNRGLPNTTGSIEQARALAASRDAAIRAYQAQTPAAQSGPVSAALSQIRVAAPAAASPANREVAPVPGAKWSPVYNQWVLPDPQRPGKWLGIGSN